MIGLIGQLTERVSRLSTPARLAWLNAVMAAALVGGAAIATAFGGSLSAVVTAWAVCTAAANVAVIPASLMRGTPGAIGGALAGTLIGMLPPLFVGLLLQQRQGELARGGVLNWILAYYLVALTVKTLLTAPNTALARREDSAAQAPGAGA